MRDGRSLSDSLVKTPGRIKPRKTFFLMVEGVSEEVYFNRIARLSEKYSLSIKVSKDKDCMGIINNCARESKRIGLEKGDLKAAVFDLDVVDRKTLQEAKKKSREGEYSTPDNKPIFRVLASPSSGRESARS